MGTTINQRIKQIIQSSGKTITSYASFIGISQPTMKAFVDGESSPRFDTLQKILSAGPEISAEWLMRGEGDMLRTTDDKRPRKINLDNYPVSNDTRGVAESSYTYGSSTTEKEYIAMLRKKDEQIDRLTRVIERLTSKL